MRSRVNRAGSHFLRFNAGTWSFAPISRRALSGSPESGPERTRGGISTAEIPPRVIFWWRCDYPAARPFSVPRSGEVNATFIRDETCTSSPLNFQVVVRINGVS